MVTLGERIRELRDKQDLSLRELAREVSVSAAFLSDVELGRRYPSDELLAKIAKRVSTTFEELHVFDSRPPVDEIKRRASASPAYGFMLRRMVDENVSAEELDKFLEERRKKDKD